MKKVIIYIGVILLIGIIAIAYHLSFPIKSDVSNLEIYIDNWANRGSSTPYPHQIDFYDSVTMGNLKYTSMELDGKLGYVLLKKSITGRYKIDHYSHGGGNYRNGVIKNKGQKYLLFIGRNTFGEISKVQFTIDSNNEYYLDIPTENIFLVLTEVDNNTEVGPVFLDKIKVYNEAGDDITSNVDLSGGSIQ